MSTKLVTPTRTEIALADAASHGIAVGPDRLTYTALDGSQQVYFRRRGSLPTSSSDWEFVEFTTSRPSGAANKAPKALAPRLTASRSATRPGTA